MNMKSIFWIVAIALLFAATAANAVPRYWNNASGGNWAEGSNWTPNGTPQYGDPVFIILPGTYTVVLDTEDIIVVRGITVGGEQAGTQTLHVDGSTLVTDQDGVVDVSGQMIFSNFGCLIVGDVGAIAIDNSFTNHGTMYFDSTSLLIMSTAYSGTAFTNESIGQIIFNGDVTVNYDFGYNPPSYVENFGTITKTGGGALDIRVPFFNRDIGTFTVESGEVRASHFETDGYMALQTGTLYTIDELDSNRYFVVDTMGTVEMFGSSQIVAATDGARTVNNGDIIHTGIDTSVIDCEFEGEFLEGWEGPVHSDLGDVFVDEGTLWFRNNHNLTFWDTVQVAPQAELIVDGNGEFREPSVIRCSVPDSGTFTLSSPAFHFIYLNTFEFSGVFNLHGPGVVYFNPANVIDTLQVLRADLGIVFNANQTIYTYAFELSGGTINANVVVVGGGGQIWTSGSLGEGGGDSVTIQPGATLEVLGPDAKSMDGSKLTIDGTANFNGSGVITTSNGASIFVGSGGTMNVGDSVKITSLTDSLINSGEMTINSPLDTSVFDLFVYNFDPFSRTPGTIDILGKSRTSRGGSNDGVIELQSDVSRDPVLTEWFITDKFTNYGVITVNSGTQIVLEDTLVNSASGVIDLIGDAAIGGNGVIQNGGQINGNDAVLSLTNRVVTPTMINLADSGFIDVLADTLTLAGGGTNYSDIEIHAGTVLVIQGVFENAAGGLIHGLGTLDVSGATFTNNGTISPGASPGIFQIIGDVTFGPTSVLLIEIRGTTPGQDHDQLQILGNLTVGGTLALLLQDGFIPELDDTLTLLSYASFSGDFAEVTGARLPDGRFLDISFGPFGMKNFICTQDPGFQASESSIAKDVPYGTTREHTLEICNNESCVLEWSATWLQTNPPSPPWLSISEWSAGTARSGHCRDLILVFEPGNLLPGLYTGNIEFLTNDSEASLVVIPVTMEVLDENVPVEFLSFSATAGPNSIMLNWSTASETNVSHFEVDRNGAAISQVSATNSATGHDYTWVDEEVVYGQVYSYTLTSVDFDGSRTIHGTVEATPLTNILPTGFSLAQNYPNPFNASTTIEYNLPDATKISLRLFDLGGREVAVLAEGTRAAGRHIINFEASDFPSGIYFYRLESPAKSISHKMILLK